MNPEFGSEKDRGKMQGNWETGASHITSLAASLSSSLKSLQLPNCMKVHCVELPREQLPERGPWAS